MKIDVYTHTVKEFNEDIYGITKYGAFVIDGASGLTNKNYTPIGNDVHWMVQWWKKYLEKNLDNTTKTIQDILKTGIEQFNEEYGQFVDIAILKTHEYLSAGIAIVRQNGDILETYVLGDVEILVEDNRGEITTITDHTIKNLDDEVIQMILANKERNIVFKGFTQEELDILIRNRSKMNKPGGYYILSHSKDAIEHGIYQKINIESVERCLLATDGLVPLRSIYDKKRLLERVKEIGAKNLIQELRDLEDKDKEKKSIGRLKTHDDATVIFVDFSL